MLHLLKTASQRPSLVQHATSINKRSIVKKNDSLFREFLKGREPAAMFKLSAGVKDYVNSAQQEYSTSYGNIFTYQFTECNPLVLFKINGAKDGKHLSSTNHAQDKLLVRQNDRSVVPEFLEYRPARGFQATFKNNTIQSKYFNLQPRSYSTLAYKETTMVWPQKRPTSLMFSSTNGQGGGQGTPPEISSKDRTTPKSSVHGKADEVDKSILGNDSISVKGISVDTNELKKRLETVVTEGVSQVRKMEWHLSDFLTVVMAASLLVAILVGPVVIDKMKESDHKYEELEDDDIINLTKFLQSYKKDDQDSESPEQNPLAAGLADVAKQVIENPEVQISLQRLALRILNSPEVLEACKILVRKTFSDLIADDDTVQQAIVLLQNVIADEDMKKSVINLVRQILQDNEVNQEITKMVVRIGQTDDVLETTKALLKESAHKTLSDPEVLDHSMAFAADVVGDDAVQRTSGEALWNTISYSVRPAFYSLLYFTGASLFVFAFVAIGKSRSYSDIAALKAISKSTGSTSNRSRSGSFSELAFWKALLRQFNDTSLRPVFHKLINLPVRLVHRAGRAMVYVITFPFLWIKVKTLSITNSTRDAICTFLVTVQEAVLRGLNRLWNMIVAYPIGLYDSTVSSISEKLGAVSTFISSSWVGTLCSVTISAGSMICSTVVDFGRGCLFATQILVNGLSQLVAFLRPANISSLSICFVDNVLDRFESTEAYINESFERLTLLLVQNTISASNSILSGWNDMLSAIFSVLRINKAKI